MIVIIMLMIIIMTIIDKLSLGRLVQPCQAMLGSAQLQLSLSKFVTKVVKTNC